MDLEIINWSEGALKIFGGNYQISKNMRGDFLIGKGVAVNEGNSLQFTGKYDHVTQILW